MKHNTPASITEDVRDFFKMTGAILRGRFKMPWKTLLWAIVCAAYLISPIDILPDILPILGITDDFAFIALVLLMIQRDVRRYRASLIPPKNGKDVLEAEVIDRKK